MEGKKVRPEMSDDQLVEEFKWYLLEKAKLSVLTDEGEQYVFDVGVQGAKPHGDQSRQR